MIGTHFDRIDSVRWTVGRTRTPGGSPWPAATAVAAEADSSRWPVPTPRASAAAVPLGGDD